MAAGADLGSDPGRNRGRCRGGLGRFRLLRPAGNNGADQGAGKRETNAGGDGGREPGLC
jgi:hypothetical protein